MEQYSIAELMEMFAFPLGVAIFVVWVFVASRGGNCFSHGRYWTKDCRYCMEERRRMAEEYDRNYQRLRRGNKSI